MPITIAQGQRAPAGSVITQGVASSGVCQDPNGCYTEAMSAPAAPAPFDSSVVHVDLMGQGQQPQVPQQAPAPRPTSTAQMLGLPQQVQSGPQCTVENGCMPPINLSSSAQRITGIPGMNPGFTGSGADPFEVWRADQFMNGLGSAYRGTGTPSSAVATAAVAQSNDRVNDLMRQGVDYQTAVFMAQRDAMDNSGYRAAGISSGVTGVATEAIDRAAQLEAERQYMRGGPMSSAAQAILPASPGTMYVGPDGQLYQSNTSANPPALGMSDAAKADPFTAAALLSNSRGLPLARAQAAQTAAANERRTMLTGQNRLLEIQAREANRVNRTWETGVDPQALRDVYDEYEQRGLAQQGIPLEVFYKQHWLPTREDRVRALPEVAETAVGF